MPTVELPSTNSASVSLVPRPHRRWNLHEHDGADRPGDEREREHDKREQRSVEAGFDGKNMKGNTSTDAMP
jgi:hypothetical protein